MQMFQKHLKPHVYCLKRVGLCLFSSRVGVYYFWGTCDPCCLNKAWTLEQIRPIKKHHWYLKHMNMHAVFPFNRYVHTMMSLVLYFTLMLVFFGKTGNSFSLFFKSMFLLLNCLRYVHLGCLFYCRSIYGAMEMCIFLHIFTYITFNYNLNLN